MAKVLLVGWGSKLENKIQSNPFLHLQNILHVDNKSTCHVQVTAQQIKEKRNTIVSDSTFVLCFDFPVVLQPLFLSIPSSSLSIYMHYK